MVYLPCNSFPSTFTSSSEERVRPKSVTEYRMQFYFILLQLPASALERPSSGNKFLYLSLGISTHPKFIFPVSNTTYTLTLFPGDINFFPTPIRIFPQSEYYSFLFSLSFQFSHQLIYTHDFACHQQTKLCLHIQ